MICKYCLQRPAQERSLAYSGACAPCWRYLSVVHLADPEYLALLRRLANWRKMEREGVSLPPPRAVRRPSARRLPGAAAGHPASC